MVRNLIVLISLLMTLYFGNMYYQETLLAIVVVELTILVVLILLPWYFSKHLKIRFEKEMDIMESKKLSTRKLIIYNDGILPISRFAYRIYVNYPNEKNSGKEYVGGAVRGKSSIEFNMQLDYCGVVEVKIDKITVYDYLSLFFIVKKADLRQTIIVIPDKNQNKIEVLEKLYNDGVNLDDNTNSIDNTDISNDFDQLREYQYGDLKRTIHWNLSAKLDKLIVKDYNSEDGNKGKLYIDYNIQDKQNIEKNDTVYKFIYKVLINLYTYYDILIVNYINNNSEINFDITNKESCIDLIIEIIKSNNLGPTQYFDEDENTYRVDAKLNLYKGNRLVYSEAIDNE